MRLAAAAGAIGLSVWAGAGLAQVYFTSPDELARHQSVACKAWFAEEGVIYATPDTKNDPKHSSRFSYYAEKFAKESGKGKVFTDCITFDRMADSLRLTFTPGATFTNIWKKQMRVAAFPGLPDDWVSKPVPGEEGPKPEAKDGELRTLTYRYSRPSAQNPGYEDASIDVKYRFVACFGELHVAYGLDVDSVKVGDRYESADGSVPVGAAPIPKPSTIDMVAVPKVALTSKHAGKIAAYVKFDHVRDALAAPALGYGCFSGQTRKIAKVADVVVGKYEPAELDAILNDALYLDHQFIGMPFLKNTLRNSALDQSARAAVQRAAAERAEAERADKERALAERRADDDRRQRESDADEARQLEQARAVQAEMQRKLEAARREEQERRAEYDRQVQRYQDQIAQNQKDVAAAAEARRQFEEKQAQYERERAAWEAKVKSQK